MITKPILDMLNTALNAEQSIPANIVHLAEDEIDWDDSYKSGIEVSTELGAPEPIWVSDVRWYSGVITINCISKEVLTARRIGDTVRGVLHRFAGTLAGRYQVTVMILATENSAPFQEDLHLVQQQYNAEWADTGE